MEIKCPKIIVHIPLQSAAQLCALQDANSASLFNLSWATQTRLHIWCRTALRPATINYETPGLKASRAKAKRPPCICQKPPHDHWRQQVFSPAGSPLNCQVGFLLGPDTVCTSAPSRSAASLWSRVQVTFLPAKALGPPQPQQICKLFTLPWKRAKANLERGPQGGSGRQGFRFQQERSYCFLGCSGVSTCSLLKGEIVEEIWPGNVQRSLITYISAREASFWRTLTKHE